jgi:uncharacterized phage protein gp47/JayE
VAIPTVSISAAGISKPAFADVLAGLVAAYQGIYGADVYIDPDSQDGQFLGILATAIDDANAVAVAVYNAFSPATAQGAGLSTVVKINGIERDDPTFSTAVVTVVGQAGVVITNGVISDAFAIPWTLPSSVTIPLVGQIDVTATCTEPGAIPALPGTLTGIVTQTPGWQTVTNAEAATPGDPVETDAQLRIRQSQSTAIPAQSIADGLRGALLDLPGVQGAQVFENDTDIVDADGIPSNAIACVVAGGNLQDIVNTIGVKKGQGVGTYGNTTGYYTDTAGTPRQVAYFVPNQIPIGVQVTLKPLTGFTTDVQNQIAQIVANTVNMLPWGDDVVRTRLYVPANLSGSAAIQYFLAQYGNDYPSALAAMAAAGLTFELVDVQISRDGQAPADADVSLLFYEEPVCEATFVQFVLQTT